MALFLDAVCSDTVLRAHQRHLRLCVRVLLGLRVLLLRYFLIQSVSLSVFTTRAARVVLFAVVSVCLFVCLFVCLSTR